MIAVRQTLMQKPYRTVVVCHTFIPGEQPVLQSDPSFECQAAALLCE